MSKNKKQNTDKTRVYRSVLGNLQSNNELKDYDLLSDDFLNPTTSKEFRDSIRDQISYEAIQKLAAVSIYETDRLLSCYNAVISEKLHQILEEIESSKSLVGEKIQDNRELSLSLLKTILKDSERSIQQFNYLKNRLEDIQYNSTIIRSMASEIKRSIEKEKES